MPQIFIVDDSVSVRKALEITLRKQALQTLCAVSGEEALETLLGEQPALDLLMVDVIMPGMSGLELCSTLRAQARYQGVPIILMSGTVDDAVRAHARDVGANAVLRKPFRPEELLPLVSELLRAAAQDSAPAAPQEPPTVEAAVTAPSAAGTPPASPDQAPRSPSSPAPATRPDLSALQPHIARHQASGRTRSMVVMNAAGQPLGRLGAPLDASLVAMLGTLLATARSAGERWPSGPLTTMALGLGTEEVRLYVAGDLGLAVVSARAQQER